MKPNHKHTPLAMQFYTHACGDVDLPPTGVEIERDSFDQFGVEHEMLTLVEVTSDDPRYRQAMTERDRLRKKINSGACCVDVVPNRQFQIEVVQGNLLMIPANDLAKAELGVVGQKAMRGIKRRLKWIERIVTIQSLTTTSDRDLQKYMGALAEIGYAKEFFKSIETNLVARGRDIASALPGR